MIHTHLVILVHHSFPWMFQSRVVWIMVVVSHDLDKYLLLRRRHILCRTHPCTCQDLSCDMLHDNVVMSRNQRDSPSKPITRTTT